MCGFPHVAVSQNTTSANWRKRTGEAQHWHQKLTTNQTTFVAEVVSQPVAVVRRAVTTEAGDCPPQKTERNLDTKSAHHSRKVEVMVFLNQHASQRTQEDPGLVPTETTGSSSSSSSSSCSSSSDVELVVGWKFSQCAENSF